MNSTYLQDRLFKQFKEFQQLNARGYTIEANLYINAVIRELAELRNVQCFFARIVESYDVDAENIEKIHHMIDELLEPIIRISDLLTIECETVYLYFAAVCIKNNESLIEIKKRLTTIKDLRVKLLTSSHQDLQVDEDQWVDIVCKAKSGDYLLH